jgi:hypothetical protein
VGAVPAQRARGLRERYERGLIAMAGLETIEAPDSRDASGGPENELLGGGLGNESNGDGDHGQDKSRCLILRASPTARGAAHG